MSGRLLRFADMHASAFSAILAFALAVMLARGDMVVVAFLAEFAPALHAVQASFHVLLP